MEGRCAAARLTLLEEEFVELQVGRGRVATKAPPRGGRHLESQGFKISRRPRNMPRPAASTGASSRLAQGL
jgi:hypothetical protein